MNILVSKELLQILELIRSEEKNVSEWAEIESGDMFQTKHLVGGFDATENEFCFSCFHNDAEYWFQLSLEEVDDIVNGNLVLVEARIANK